MAVEIPVPEIYDATGLHSWRDNRGMASLPIQAWTLEEYLSYEAGIHDRGEASKHEFIDGSILAMAGASFGHNRVVMNVAAALHRRRRTCGCSVLSNDMRVRIEHETTWVYPDVAVVCGEPELLDTRPQTLLNPTVLVEVLSPSTAAYDRNLKGPRYRSCPSLRELLIVDPTAVCIEHWSRTGTSEWTVDELRQLDGVLKLDSMAAEIPVAEFYEE